MIYRCRFIIPNVSGWHKVEAESPELAVNEFHSWHVPHRYLSYDTSSITYAPDQNKPGRLVYFARIEVEGEIRHESWISRMFTSQILRRGGVKIRRPTLAEIAKQLGWEGPPEELLSSGWFGEEEDWS